MMGDEQPGSSPAADPSAHASPGGSAEQQRGVWDPFDQGGRDNFPGWGEVWAARPSSSGGSGSGGSQQQQLDIDALSRQHPADIPLVFPPGYGSAFAQPQPSERWFDAEAARKRAQVRRGPRPPARLCMHAPRRR